MNNVHILFHIKTVGTAFAVNFVAAVVGAEAVENGVILPFGIDFCNKLFVEIKVHFKSCKGFFGFGAVFMHCAVVVAVINNNQIKAVFINKLKSFFVDLFGSVINKILQIQK